MRSAATHGRALRSRRPLTTHHSPATTATAAFTLIELLVTMTILVILAGLVIVAVQPENDDRISASARTVQSYLEGAKSRAISEQQPVGVRLIPSQNDRRVVDSLQYIAGNTQLEGTLDIARDANGRWIIANSVAGQWPRMNAGGRRLIQPGQRIEIPAGTGNWYTLGLIEDLDDDRNLDPNEDDGMASQPFDNQNGVLDVVVYHSGFMVDMMSIRGHYQLSEWDAGAGAYQAQPATNIPYRLELAASTLPDSDPVQLERAVVIDIDASDVPASWRVGMPMDIMFDARGNPTGGLVAQGLIHLYITTVGDVELTRLLGGVRHAAGGGGGCTGMGDYVVPLVPANPPNTPETEPRIVTLFTQTGQVMRSQVDFTDTRDNCDPTVTTPDLIADNPYAYARRGREAQ